MNLDNLAKYLPAGLKLIPENGMVSFEISEDEILELCDGLHNDCGLPLKLITATDERQVGEGFKIFYVFGVPKQNYFLVPYLKLKTESFPSISSKLHEASIFERKIKTFFGLEPIGNLNTLPVILQENWPDGIYPLRKDFAWNQKVATATHPDYFSVFQGEGVYEIPVGPVHAGIIEPGYFRFSVLGEEILLLQAQLGCVHKGSEKLFETLTLADKLKLSEKISGDSTFSHSLAFCQVIENLAELKISERTKYLRVLFSELERLANHFGDIGAIMLDAGFNFGGANGARVREVIMQINERLTGSRFFRGVNTFGDILADISKKLAADLIPELEAIKKDFDEVIEIAENSHSLLNRLKKTGLLEKEIASDHGVVGVAARACGISFDVRTDYPYAAYDKVDFKIQTETGSDVYARFWVRIKEARASFEMIEKVLKNLPESIEKNPVENLKLAANAYAIGITEGWRGDIVYFVATDKDGQISRVDVRDPSLLNWTAVPYAVKGNIVPDFPLINKSFNLSYSGNDV
ncbi:MAG: NADH-quinone oxidoreductase subunit C [Patescibacteria group bacterium]